MEKFFTGTGSGDDLAIAGNGWVVQSAAEEKKSTCFCG